MRRPERGEWTLEVAVRRAVHRQQEVREERLRRDQRVVPAEALGSKRGLELALNTVVVVARRRALRVAIRAAVMARIKYHVPQSAKRRERIIRPAVAFVVPACKSTSESGGHRVDGVEAMTQRWQRRAAKFDTARCQSWWCGICAKGSNRWAVCTTLNPPARPECFSKDSQMRNNREATSTGKGSGTIIGAQTSQMKALKKLSAQWSM